METIDLLSQIWPEWKVESEIGSGSFGRVYKAVRTENTWSAEAAIKIIEIPPEGVSVESLCGEGMDHEAAQTYIENLVNGLLDEIQLMVSLKGAPNIVGIEDYKVVKKPKKTGWVIFIRMELLTPLTKRIASGPLTEEETVRLGKDICSALRICEEQNIIHRDIKPQNIFVDRFGSFKLGDFGIARRMESATEGMSHKGTYNYMAPEVFGPHNYDQRVDIYSLGIMLFQLRNKGMLPFIRTQEQWTNPTERGIAIQRRFSGEKIPEPLDASPGLAKVILKACAYEPSERYDDAAQMYADLSAIPVVPTAEKKREAYVSPVPETKTVSLDDAPGKTVVIQVPETDSNETGVVSVIPGQTAVQHEEPKKKKPAFLYVLPVLMLAVGAAGFLLLKGAEKPASPQTYIVPLETVSGAGEAAADASETEEEEERFVMPDVVGMPREDAVLLLNRLGAYWSVDTSYSDTVEKGVVLSQDAAEGAELTKDNRVCITVSAGPDRIDRITVVKHPTAEQFFIGDYLKPKLFYLNVTYKSGKTQRVDSGFDISPLKLTEVGSQKVTVTYEGMTAYYYLDVKDIVLTGIKVKSVPKKTEYRVGEYLDVNGLSVSANYSNGTIKDMKSGFTCSPNMLDRAGEQKITVSFEGKTASFIVTVQENHESGRISGRIIGNKTGWSGDTDSGAASAFDGDKNTFFDPLGVGDGYCGIDAYGVKHILTKVRVLARSGWTDRTKGAVIQGSNNGETWITLCSFKTEGLEGAYITIDTFTNNNGYSMFRYYNEENHGDVAEVELYGYGLDGHTAERISGAVIGSELGWMNNPDVGARAAFDGNPATYFDPPETGVGYCGIDAGAGKSFCLTEVLILSRADWEMRLDGAVIEGSNNMQKWTKLCTFSGEGSNVDPVISVSFEHNTGYRYFRYYNEVNHGDVAEIELYGYEKQGQ